MPLGTPCTLEKNAAFTDSASRHSLHLEECLQVCAGPSGDRGQLLMSKYMYLQIVPLGIPCTLLGNAYMGAASYVKVLTVGADSNNTK